MKRPAACIGGGANSASTPHRRVAKKPASLPPTEEPDTLHFRGDQQAIGPVAVRLSVRLLSGDTQVDLDAPAEDLVGQVARRAAVALKKPRLRLITEAGTVLRAWDKVGDAGLVDGQGLTGLVERPIPSTFVDVYLGTAVDWDTLAANGTSEQGFENQVLRFYNYYRSLDAASSVPWARLSDLAGLAIRNPIEPADVDPLANALRSLPQLRRLDLMLKNVEEDACTAILKAVTGSLEHLCLDVTSCGKVVKGAGRFTQLRVLQLKSDPFFREPVDSSELAELLRALPPSVEELMCPCHENVQPVAECLRNMPQLVKADLLCHGYGSDYGSLLAALPASLEELHLKGLAWVRPSTHAVQVQNFRRLGSLRCLSCLPPLTSAVAALAPGLERLTLRLPLDQAAADRLAAALRGRRQDLGLLRDVTLWGAEPGSPAKGWAEVVAALPPGLEVLFLRASDEEPRGKRTATVARRLRGKWTAAVAGHLRRFPRLRTLRLGGFGRQGQLRNLWSALPGSLANLQIDDYVPAEEVLALRAKLDHSQLQQLLGVDITVCSDPQASSRFKALLRNGPASLSD